MSKGIAGKRLAGVELYSSDLERSRAFYERVLALKVAEEEAGHHVMFDTGEAFLCLEKPGVENYPSQDKAVIFFEVDDLGASVASIGQERFVKYEPESGWAVLHDPDGHNVLLLQKGRR
jgi:catechol 2,3-dioxygenase-like lactoylglutathione lyase family enzyme